LEALKMNILSILRDIDFTEREIEQYQGAELLAGNTLDTILQEYLDGKVDIWESLKRAKAALPECHEYTVELLFVIKCLPTMHSRYVEAGLSSELFINACRDIRCKLTECEKRFKVFGTSVGYWYHGFFILKRFAFGRLQFDDAIAPCDAEAGGHTLHKGDFMLSCHIPSMGRLLHEDCIDSYKRAYAFFRDRGKSSPIPIYCHSWLFYPDYMSVFGEESNTGRFVRDYHIFETFTEDWHKNTVLDRVFSAAPDTDVDTLPRNTSMQRGFIEYFKSDKPHGNARGLFFFDGENVIN
jgi:hypothetical protein